MSTAGIILAGVLAGAVGVAAYMWNNYRRRKRLQGQLVELGQEFAKAIKERQKRVKQEIESKALQEASKAVKKANEEAAKAINLANYLNDRTDN